MIVFNNFHDFAKSFNLPYGCCLPTPITLTSGGESDLPACGPPASFSVHLAGSAVTPAGSVHKSRGDNVGVLEEMMCVVCDSVSEGE